MKTNNINQYNWQYLRLFFALLVVLIGSSTASHGQGQSTVLIANFMNGNDAALNSRVYLWNPSASPGGVTVRVFTLPLTSGLAQELTVTPFSLGTLGAKSALNVKLAEDILTPLGMTMPYTDDGGNLTLEFTIQAANVRGAVQVFSSSFAFGTYPLQVIPGEQVSPQSLKLSSGLFGLPANAASVDWMVVNNSTTVQTITVTVFKAGVLKTVVAPGPLNITLVPGQVTHNANSVPSIFVPGFYYEVVVETADPNVLPSVHVWDNSVNRVIPGTLIPPGSWVRLE